MPLNSVDRAAIEAVLTRQSAAWVAGDADAFAADAQEGVLFTNVVGMFSIGRAPPPGDVCCASKKESQSSAAAVSTSSSPGGAFVLPLFRAGRGWPGDDEAQPPTTAIP